MEETQQPTQPTEVCTMRIAFPVDSDEQAIEVKRKIGEVLKGIPETQIQFSISSMPKTPNLNASRIR